HIFQHVWTDLKRLPSQPTAVALGGGLAAAAAFHPLDDNLAGWIAHKRPSSELSTTGNILGGGWLEGGAAAAVWALGEEYSNRTAIHLGSDLIRAQALNGVITTALKYSTGRTRPNGNAWSFPSGHTSASFASAAVLAHHYGWKIGALGYTVASAVAWSRLRTNDHWLSDVIAGASIGLASGLSVTD